MADNPNIQWALDILTPEPDYKPSLFVEYSFVVGTPVTLVIGAATVRMMTKRPAFSGLQLHIFAGLVGFVCAYKAKEWYFNSFALRDHYLRDYVIKHPEDFPPPERKKWGEVFTKWAPIRS